MPRTIDFSKITGLIFVGCAAFSLSACEGSAEGGDQGGATSASAVGGTSPGREAAQHQTGVSAEDGRGARSAYGKAMESAERLKDDVAESNRKLEEAADGKYK